MGGARVASRWHEKDHNRRNGKKKTTGETAPKMDEQCTGHHNGTYVIMKIN